jgi:hypothetical protein
MTIKPARPRILTRLMATRRDVQQVSVVFDWPQLVRPDS